MWVGGTARPRAQEQAVEVELGLGQLGYMNERERGIRPARKRRLDGLDVKRKERGIFLL
jgi:hypothetical protein